MKKISEYLLVAFLVHLCIGAWWIGYYFGKVSGDEMFFHLLVPLSGINNDTFISYFCCAVLPSIIVSIAVFLIINKYLKNRKKLIYFIGIVFSVLFFIFKLDFHSYIYDQIVKSNFIEDNYVDTSSVELKFPDEKRNLIFIFLESMEVTYADRLNGGAWTVASIVSHTSGLPLKINTSSNGIIDFNNFMPNVITIGDILKENGYSNYFIAGSDTNYGARKNYFEQHGNYSVYDVNNALETGKIKEKVWWGFDDNYLFEIAKEQLLKISLNDAPFNYMMLTADTHFEDGYLTDDCEDKFNDQYSNVIYCSDKKVVNFLKWLENQDFYDQTVIVLVGDHKSMDTDYFDNVSKDYVRTNYNVFINSVVVEGKFVDRNFTALDLFPTTLASMGVEIDGNRLGLGVNLFSDEKSLVEEYGYDYVFSHLKRRSSFYNNKFLAYK